jgi:hypothetical protein
LNSSTGYVGHTITHTRASGVLSVPADEGATLSTAERRAGAYQFGEHPYPIGYVVHESITIKMYIITLPIFSVYILTIIIE